MSKTAKILQLPTCTTHYTVAMVAQECAIFMDISSKFEPCLLKRKDKKMHFFVWSAKAMPRDGANLNTTESVLSWSPTMFCRCRCSLAIQKAYFTSFVNISVQLGSCTINQVAASCFFIFQSLRLQYNINDKIDEKQKYQTFMKWHGFHTVSKIQIYLGLPPSTEGQINYFNGEIQTLQT